MRKFGDIRTTFILWNDIQPGMMFIRPFECVIYYVEIVDLPFIHARQSVTGIDCLANGWRGIQALDYNVPTEQETIQEAFDEQVQLIGSESYL